MWLTEDEKAMGTIWAWSYPGLPTDVGLLSGASFMLVAR